MVHRRSVGDSGVFRRRQNCGKCEQRGDECHGFGVRRVADDCRREDISIEQRCRRGNGREKRLVESFESGAGDFSNLEFSLRGTRDMYEVTPRKEEVQVSGNFRERDTVGDDVVVELCGDVFTDRAFDCERRIACG